MSMAYTFDQANAKAPSKRDTQYFEMAGNRAIYHDGWVAATTPFAPPWDLATGKVTRNKYRHNFFGIPFENSRIL
jgi:arylsulfatase